jgi:hypothetical protein
MRHAFQGLRAVTNPNERVRSHPYLPSFTTPCPPPFSKIRNLGSQQATATFPTPLPSPSSKPTSFPLPPSFPPPPTQSTSRNSRPANNIIPFPIPSLSPTPSPPSPPSPRPLPPQTLTFKPFNNQAKTHVRALAISPTIERRLTLERRLDDCSWLGFWLLGLRGGTRSGTRGRGLVKEGFSVWGLVCGMWRERGGGEGMGGGRGCRSLGVGGWID